MESLQSAIYNSSDKKGSKTPVLDDKFKESHHFSTNARSSAKILWYRSLVCSGQVRNHFFGSPCGTGVAGQSNWSFAWAGFFRQNLDSAST